MKRVTRLRHVGTQGYVRDVHLLYPVLRNESSLINGFLEGDVFRLGKVFESNSPKDEAVVMNELDASAVAGGETLLQQAGMNNATINK
jgi:hypothetical protein